MVRAIKWLLASIVSLVLVLVIAVFTLTLVIDPNSYKPKLQELAAGQGINLEMRGDLSWRFLPNLAIELNDSTLSIPSQGIENFAFENIRFSLDKWQLLHRNVVFQAIEIENADITVRKLTDAGKIAAIPAAGSHKTAPASTVTTTATSGASSGSSFSLAVKAFSIRNSRLKILQEASDLRFTDIDFSVQNVNLDNQPFPIRLAFKHILNQKNADKKATGVQPTLAISASTEVSIQIDAENASLAALFNQTNQASVETAKTTLSKTLIEGQYNTGGQATPIKTSFDATIDHKLDQLSINDWEISLANLSGNGHLIVTELKTMPRYKGALAITIDDLPTLFKQLHLDAKAPVTQASLKTELSGTAEQVNLDNLILQLEKQRFTGHLNLGIKTPRNLDLVLNGSEWRLPKADETTQSTGSNEPATTGLLTALLAPLAVLDGGNTLGGKGHIELSLAALHMPEYSITNLKTNLFSNQNIIHIAEISGQAFKGNFTGSGRIDLNKSIPMINVTTRINDMDLQQALTRLGGYSDFQGNLTLDLTASSQGDSFEQLKANAIGQGKFNIKQPIIQNLNIEKSVCEATALINSNQAYNPANAKNQTTLEDIKGNIAIKGNVISVKQVTTQTGNLVLQANGDIHLLKETIAVLANARIQGDKTSEQGCSVNKRLRYTDIPIQCTGTFTNKLSCKPDQNWINSMVKNALLNEISDRLLKNQQKSTEDKTNTEGEQPNQNKTDIEKAQETLDLLKGIFK